MYIQIVSCVCTTVGSKRFVSRQDKTSFMLTKYIILRPGAANSIANLGWPGDKIKKQTKNCCNYLRVKYTS